MKCCTLMKNTWIFAIISALVLAAATTIAVSAEHRHQGSADHKGPNALVEEMRRLDKAFHEIVSGVALNDSRRVRAAIESLHGAFAKTQDALYHGEAELRKNPQDAKVFERMDRDFHKDLEALSHAAEKNDSKRMNELTKKLLDGCVSCHKSFRP